MITGLIDLIMGAGLQLVLLLLGLFPSIDVASLPLGMPQAARDALSTLNWFVPIGDLVAILTVWSGLVLAVNVALIVQRLVTSVKG